MYILIAVIGLGDLRGKEEASEVRQTLFQLGDFSAEITGVLMSVIGRPKNVVCAV
jgi:hypothetical protein